jgi:hypothetical protein
MVKATLVIPVETADNIELFTKEYNLVAVPRVDDIMYISEALILLVEAVYHDLYNSEESKLIILLAEEQAEMYQILLDDEKFTLEEWGSEIRTVIESLN